MGLDKYFFGMVLSGILGVGIRMDFEWVADSWVRGSGARGPYGGVGGYATLEQGALGFDIYAWRP